MYCSDAYLLKQNNVFYQLSKVILRNEIMYIEELVKHKEVGAILYTFLPLFKIYLLFSPPSSLVRPFLNSVNFALAEFNLRTNSEDQLM